MAKKVEKVVEPEVHSESKVHPLTARKEELESHIAWLEANRFNSLGTIQVELAKILHDIEQGR